MLITLLDVYLLPLGRNQPALCSLVCISRHVIKNLAAFLKESKTDSNHSLDRELLETERKLIL